MLDLSDHINYDYLPAPSIKSSSSPQIKSTTEIPLTNENLATILKADLQSRKFLLQRELNDIGNGCLASLGICKILSYMQINDHESTVNKIQEFVESLISYGNIPVNFSLKGQELCNLDLTQTVRSSILKNTNAAQLMQFQRSVGRSSFERFCSEALTETQGSILSIFSDMENMTIRETKLALMQLKDFVPSDSSLWDEIIDALVKHCKHIPQIKETLFKIGQQLRFYPLRPSIYIRIMSEDFQKHSRMKVNLKKFQNIPYFDSFIEEAQFIGDTDAVIILKNRDKKHFNAWVKLIQFINTNDISLDNDSAFTLLPIAKSVNAKECVIICYEHLWKNRYAFNKFSFLDFMLKHKTPYVRNIEQDILRLVQESLKKWAYPEIERFLELQKAYSLQLDIKHEIREAIKVAKAQNLKDFYPLYKSKPFQHLFPIIKSIFDEKSNPDLSNALVINDDQQSSEDGSVEILDLV